MANKRIKNKRSRFFSSIKNRFDTVIDRTRKFFEKRVNMSKYDLWEDMHDNEISNAADPFKAALDWFETFRNDPKNQFGRKSLQSAQLYVFDYDHPLNEDTLEFFDKQPLVLSFGSSDPTKEHNIRDRGINLHLLPPRVSRLLLYRIFNIYRIEFHKNFEPDKQISFRLDWHVILKACEDLGVDFAYRSYATHLRSNTVMIPMGEWSKAAWVKSKGYKGTTLVDLERRWREHTRNRNVPAMDETHIRK